MNILDSDRTERTFGNYFRYEGTISKFGGIIVFTLMAEDFITRLIVEKHEMDPVLLIFQFVLLAAYVLIGVFKLKNVGQNGKESGKVSWMCKIADIVIMVVFISTMYHSVFFYFVALLPIAFISLSRGFSKSIPYILSSWGVQALSQYIVSTQFTDLNMQGIFDEPFVLIITVTLQYFLFAFFSYIWGAVHNEYARSEEENNMLIERLGDKYVQLEQAKKEIQINYDKTSETNEQLEESNRKLTSSLAEFYTLQQISQAISSIFDMNELLKFVNDVIIGVMGVFHSTIALCHGAQGKLKVQVSSIFDKKELAIVADYINSDVLKPSVEDGHSMIDNSVNPDEYPFTQGRNIKSLICVPLIAKGHVLGVVLIEHSIPNAFDTDNARLLEIISQQVSIAIENARLYQQMRELATLDGLTGSFNRLYFQDNLQIEFKKAQEGNYDLSLLMFDIDLFKKFNDTYGHMFGDLVLRTISAYILKKLRKGDIFARYGGEEFVILMPHTTLDQIAEKAEDVRAGVAALNISDRVISASVTISIGVSTFPDRAGTQVELVKTADDALYEAKHAGRNQVRIAKPKGETMRKPENT